MVKVKQRSLKFPVGYLRVVGAEISQEHPSWYDGNDYKLMLGFWAPCSMQDMLP